MNLNVRRVLITALLLAGFAALGVGLVAYTQEKTASQIAQNEQMLLLAQISAVLPPGSYENNPVDSAFLLPDPQALNLPKLEKVHQVDESLLHEAKEAGLVGYRATAKGKVTAVVIPVITHAGYSGDIKLIVGIDRKGVITGVRVTRENETPGLGDKIEASKTHWIFGFKDRSLSNPHKQGWAVKKDGGVFDQFTGATITPRAVVGAIHNALLYARAHHEQLFEPHESEHEGDGHASDAHVAPVRADPAPATQVQAARAQRWLLRAMPTSQEKLHHE